MTRAASAAETAPLKGAENSLKSVRMISDGVMAGFHSSGEKMESEKRREAGEKSGWSSAKESHDFSSTAKTASSCFSSWPCDDFGEGSGMSSMATRNTEGGGAPARACHRFGSVKWNRNLLPKHPMVTASNGRGSCSGESLNCWR